MVSFVLYFVLGLTLNFCGINAVNEPLEFIAIMAIVVMIDANARFG